MQDGLDIRTDAGRLALRILLSVAEFRLDGIREGWEVAREHASAEDPRGWPTPVGYRKTRGGRLRPHPRTAPIISELYRRRVAGESLLRCCEFLERERVLTGKRNPGWSPSALSNMLRSRVYLRRGVFGPLRTRGRSYGLDRSGDVARGPAPAQPAPPRATARAVGLPSPVRLVSAHADAIRCAPAGKDAVRQLPLPQGACRRSVRRSGDHHGQQARAIRHRSRLDGVARPSASAGG